MVLVLELIIGGCVYVLTQAGIGVVIFFLKKTAGKKYNELIQNLESMSSKNSELYSLLSQEEGTPRDRNLVNEPINEPINDDEPETHRDIVLNNGNIIRIKRKI